MLSRGSGFVSSDEDHRGCGVQVRRQLMCQEKGLPDAYSVHGFVQATSMSSDEITEDAVYSCTGNPLPKDIEQVAHWLLNETFSDAFDSAF